MPPLPRVLSGCLALVVTLAGGLCGCTPVIEGWRDVSGISKNDPGPDAPFTKNLAEAEAEPYPNLATVPPPPTRATTAAERQKLTQSLVAERAAAAAAGRTVTAGAPAAPAARSALVRSPAPAIKTAAAEPGTGAALGVRQAAASPSAEVNPPEARLVTPEVRSLPEPEAARPAPPPPHLPVAPRPAVAAEPAPAALASVRPEVPPPMPDLAPPPPLPVPTGKPAAQPRSGLTTVATLAGSAPISGDRAEIERLAARYKQAPGRVRVVAYAAAPAAGGDPLASYQAALDRAQTVASALVGAGIPAGKIQTEATPAAATAGAGRVEIQFGP